MSPYPRMVWNITLLLLVGLSFLVLAVFAIAYGSGGPPAFIGHPSEEILFTYDNVQTICNPASFGSTCAVTCPLDSFLLTGYCGSIAGTGWTWLGRIEPGGQTYTCVDESHMASSFVARATCMHGGVVLSP